MPLFLGGVRPLTVMCPLLLHSTLRVPSPCVCRQHENTSVPGIYALGDCTTHGFELTPVAIAAGRRLADRLFAGEPRARIAYETIATVVFSHPPIGTIGLTEPDARREFGEANVTVKQARFASMQYGLNAADAKVKTALKLVLAGPEERVVGLHCIGPFSDEMMQACAAHAHGMCSTCTRHVHVMYHVRGMCISCSCSCHVHGICIDAYVYVHGCPSR